MEIYSKRSSLYTDGVLINYMQAAQRYEMSKLKTCPSKHVMLSTMDYRPFLWSIISGPCSLIFIAFCHCKKSVAISINWYQLSGISYQLPAVGYQVS
jgi:hypothetical protein